LAPSRLDPVRVKLGATAAGEVFSVKVVVPETPRIPGRVATRRARLTARLRNAVPSGTANGNDTE
jgi:hypothetical protein